MLEDEDEGDYFGKDPWAKRGEFENSFEPSGATLLDKRGPGVVWTVWDPVLKLWVLEGDENEGDFFEKDTVFGMRNNRRLLLGHIYSCCTSTLA